MSHLLLFGVTSNLLYAQFRLSESEFVAFPIISPFSLISQSIPKFAIIVLFSVAHATHVPTQEIGHSVGLRSGDLLTT